MKIKLNKNPLKSLYAAYFGLWTLITFIILYPAIYYTLSNPKRYAWGHRVRRIWGWILLRVCFVRVKQIVEEKLDTTKPYIITPNHQSYIDIITLTVKLNQLNFSFMAKAELAKIPLFGIWFRTVDINVDRKNIRKAAEAYKKATRFFDSGRSLVIFPEGTIGTHVPKMLKFKDGPFRLAIEKQIDILPVTILGNHIILADQDTLDGRPGTVYQYIHKPISTKNLTMDDVDALREKVYHIIQNKLTEYGY